MEKCITLSVRLYTCTYHPITSVIYVRVTCLSLGKYRLDINELSAIILYFLFFPESDASRSKTLHKLRSKTIALFSKDGGYSTLPK